MSFVLSFSKKFQNSFTIHTIKVNCSQFFSEYCCTAGFSLWFCVNPLIFFNHFFYLKHLFFYLLQA